MAASTAPAGTVPDVLNFREHLKLLRSREPEKLIEGCRLCRDAAFIRTKGGYACLLKLIGPKQVCNCSYWRLVCVCVCPSVAVALCRCKSSRAWCWGPSTPCAASCSQGVPCMWRMVRALGLRCALWLLCSLPDAALFVLEETRAKQLGAPELASLLTAAGSTPAMQDHAVACYYALTTAAMGVDSAAEREELLSLLETQPGALAALVGALAHRAPGCRLRAMHALRMLSTGVDDTAPPSGSPAVAGRVLVQLCDRDGEGARAVLALAAASPTAADGAEPLPPSLDPREPALRAVGNLCCTGARVRVCVCAAVALADLPAAIAAAPAWLQRRGALCCGAAGPCACSATPWLGKPPPLSPSPPPPPPLPLRA